jgi:nitrite reductase/ring-hydroxylating ferredoxin subunit
MVAVFVTYPHQSKTITMFGYKLRWYRLFENQDELDEVFYGKSTTVYRSIFGEVLLVKQQNKYSAFQNKCPHQGKPLNDCWIENNQVVCPFHKYHYSIENGRGHGLYLEKYELKIDETGVFLGKESWGFF